MRNIERRHDVKRGLSHFGVIEIHTYYQHFLLLKFNQHEAVFF